jgi:type 1 glutamine amidotransferase/mono/diheme cytochrome c family protein
MANFKATPFSLGETRPFRLEFSDAPSRIRTLTPTLINATSRERAMRVDCRPCLSRTCRSFHLLLLALLSLPAIAAAEVPSKKPQDQPRKIVLIAGPKSHGPVGNGIHDYPWSVKLLKVMLDNSNVKDRVKVEYHLDGGPGDWSTLDDADTIMVISDGRDGELFAEAPHFASEERVAAFEKQMKRGCGFLTFHFSTFAPDKYAEQILSWSGGYFDWETDGKRQWYSAIATKDAAVELPSPGHAVLRGVKPFKLREEFYYNLRFKGDDKTLVPLFAVPDLAGREPDGRVVAWCRERLDGGRGFGTTCGHFYDNWKNDDFRRTILNALVWSAGLEVPEDGVASKYFTHAEITSALAGVTGMQRAVVDDQPLRVLMFAGNDAHKWHNWERTTPAIKAALETDPRIKVDVTLDIEDLAKRDLSQYQVIVQNYVNWHDPKSLSDASRSAFVKFVEKGGGLILPHFSASAFHFSLPMAEKSDWPEYRKLSRRVWDHFGKGEEKSGHDAFGPFTANISEITSPLTAGLKAFPVVDELYFRQAGSEPIEPLITAKSKVTNREEPLAWTFTYGKGRVFQTLLGHSEKTYDAFEAREMMRRAAAWTAGRRVLALAPSEDPTPVAAPAEGKPTATQPTTLTLVEGKFGKAMDAKAGGAMVAGTAAFHELPLTLELWAKLANKGPYNILVAQEPKSSATHWELFTMAGSGQLTVYLPGMTPDHVGSEANICDGQWHALAMVFEAERVRLYVDGKQVADQKVAANGSKKVAGSLRDPKPSDSKDTPSKSADSKAEKAEDKDSLGSRSAPATLAIGRLVEGGIGCDGLIDDVRISKGLREITNAPTKPLDADAATLGLWPFDTLDEKKQSPDASAGKQPAMAAIDSQKSSNSVTASAGNHFGIDSVGFNWTEQDSVDDRWKQSDIGPCLASSLPIPNLPVVAKGLSIKLGERNDASVCYDTATGALRAAWTGGFLKFNPARYGIISPPAISGALLCGSRETPGWSPGRVQFSGHRLHGQRVVLEYRIEGAANDEAPTTTIRESPSVVMHDGTLAVARSLEVNNPKPWLTMNVLHAATPARMIDVEGVRAACVEDASRATAVALVPSATVAKDSLTLQASDNGLISIALTAPRESMTFRVLTWSGPKADLPKFAALVRAEEARSDSIAGELKRLLSPGEARWNDPVVTRGVVGEGGGAYVVDTLTLPFDNPWNALFFCSGHDFFPNGDIAVCTVHGDVWRVSGVDTGLKQLRWKRFATGLFQPLGLKIVGDVVHVLGRDQITKLHDENGDGEADHYECFSNAQVTSAGGHDYVACLETDRAGNFYCVHANMGLVKVSKDGKTLSVVAAGLRNPNGLGIGPHDEITASPQEGNWTPGSSIIAVRTDGYYGFGGPKVTPKRPLGYDAPLVWIPRMQDNSSGGQAWVTSERWGPLQGQMLHFSFGKCRTMLVVGGQGSGVRIQDSGKDKASDDAAATRENPLVSPSQIPDSRLLTPSAAGVVDLPLDFDSGVMRGRFSPHDGQLYVSGLKGWVSSAVKDGCLQRVRFTGKPVDMPIGLKTHRNGLAITFTRPLRKEQAEDPENYHVQRWNYRYSAEYGSPDFKASDATQEGRDDVPVLSATLLDDARTVFLELPEMKPVMQLSVEYKIADAEGALLKQTLNTTIHAVGEDAMDEARLVRRTRPGQLAPEIEKSLQPGLQLRVENAFARSSRTSLVSAGSLRMAALFESKEDRPEHAVPFVYYLSGYLKIPLRSQVRFHWEGEGVANLTINEQPVFSGAPAESESQPVTLHAGYNFVRLTYALPEPRGARFRLLWKGEDFAAEPVPPTLLFHRVVAGPTQERASAQEGRELVARFHCLKCHSVKNDASDEKGMLEFRLDPPNLAGAASLRREWIARWLLEPSSLRAHPTMPRLLDPDDKSSPQVAADLASFLSPGAQAVPVERKAEEDKKLASRGRTLFEDLGCIACHRLTAVADEDEHDRLSLAEVSSKFRPDHLAKFLESPHRHYPASRMPDFQLDASEIEALVAYLTTGRAVASEEQVVGDAERGRVAFAKLGCGQCHAVGEQKLDPLPKIAWPDRPLPSVFKAYRPKDARVVRGNCLAEQPEKRGRAPTFIFSADERSLLQAVSYSSLTSHDTPAEASARLMKRLQCGACHPRDGASAKRMGILLDESDTGLVPETYPSLTWAGEKLHPDWTRDLLAGKFRERTRPWMKGRMPAFPAYANALARGLAAEHGVPFERPAASAVNAELAETGRKLMQKDALDCRQCHAFGKEPALGDKGSLLAPGINFALTRDRVRFDYYQRFLLDPPRFDISSRMPKLAADGRTTKAVQYFDGDAHRQFEAVWHALRQSQDQ